MIHSLMMIIVVTTLIGTIMNYQTIHPLITTEMTTLDGTIRQDHNQTMHPFITMETTLIGTIIKNYQQMLNSLIIMEMTTIVTIGTIITMIKRHSVFEFA